MPESGHKWRQGMNLVVLYRNAVRGAPGSIECLRFTCVRTVSKSFCIRPFGPPGPDARQRFLTCCSFSTMRVLSGLNSDLATQFVHWRGFGFGEIARGNLPLWNPAHLLRGSFSGRFPVGAAVPLNVLYLGASPGKGRQFGASRSTPFSAVCSSISGPSSGACTRWPVSWRVPSSSSVRPTSSHLRGALAQSLHHDLGPAAVSGH